jgi:hypothetical protein
VILAATIRIELGMLAERVAITSTEPLLRNRRMRRPGQQRESVRQRSLFRNGHCD